MSKHNNPTSFSHDNSETRPFVPVNERPRPASPFGTYPTFEDTPGHPFSGF